ncbi:MAG: hypothetical protein K9N51_01755 [Candidatus Pacebacteria bacterium]|nr:hypothetical protein [Candidatus Paceibacterota bacterium]
MKSKKEQAKSSAKDTLYKRVIPELMRSSPYFSLEAVRKAMNELGVSVTAGTLKFYMSDAMSKGIVHDAGRGWYSSIAQPFELDTQPVADIVQRLNKAFPLLDFSCWSTRQINPHMHHLLAKFVTFIHVDEAGMRSIGDWLLEAGYNVFVNPGKVEVEKSFRVRDKTVVVRPGFVEETEEASHVAPIEMILADLLYEAEKLPLMARDEARDAVENAMLSGRISTAYFVTLAKRRHVDAFIPKSTN